MILNKVKLENGTKTVTADSLTMMVSDSSLNVTGFFDHTKASERYVIVSVRSGANRKTWYLPFYYRRTNVYIDIVEELVVFLKTSKELLTAKSIATFVRNTRKLATDVIGSRASVTLPIFNRLLDDCGKWVLNKDFNNSNSQRRIQDIKECGFTIATKFENRKTYHMLLPFDIVRAPTYETIPTKVRKAILAALDGIDAYSGGKAKISVLPDHKFPEVRWDKSTAVSNGQLTVEMMREKFQLVPESINQAKREVCRKCFQTGKRGKFNGIDFYYAGDECWPDKVPKVGKAAKIGCVGCFWYDMSAWRKALNRIIMEANSK